MWAELIFSRDDLARLLEEALPLVIRFDEGGTEHSLSLTSLGEVTLVADKGLRVSCRAHVHWPVLGLEVPVDIKSLTLVLMPTIGRSPEGDTLVFRVTLEEADIAGIPSVIDHKITSAINSKLAEKDAELSWNFSHALAFVAPLPAMLEPLQSFAIKPAWGKVRITDEAIVYAASFHSALVRRGNPIPEEIASSLGVSEVREEPLPPAHTNGRASSGAGVVDRYVALGVMGVAAGVTFLALRGASGLRRSSSGR